MKVLFLALYPPFPAVDGGRIRTFNTLKQISARHKVSLLCFEDPLAASPHQNVLQSLCQEVYTVPKPAKRRRSLADKLVDLFRLDPVGLKGHYSPEMASLIRKAILNDNYDLVHIDQILLAQYTAAMANVPWVLTHHNIEALAQSRQHSIDQRSLFKKISDRLERARWKRYEIQMSRRAGAVVTVSEFEARYFRQFVSLEKVFVSPNGVDLEYFQPVERTPTQLRLLFTGRMDYPPNVDAMLWFCQEVWPALRREIPDVELLIVGRDPAPQIRNLDGSNGVIVTGMVDDVRPFYAQASVFIVPLRSGGGTRLKILEALAMGMPVVTTSLGCEGLEVVNGRDLLVVDEQNEFVRKIFELLQSPTRRIELGKCGRRLVVEKYSWESSCRCMQKAYEYAVEGHVK